MAGSFSFAYDYHLMDAVLGSSNLSFTWYSLFKQKSSTVASSNAVTTEESDAVPVSNGSGASIAKQAADSEEKWLARCSEQNGLRGSS